MSNGFVGWRAVKCCLLAAICGLFFCDAFGVHMRRHILIVNMLTNKERRSALPEGICEVVLREDNKYDLEYKEKRLVNSEELAKIGKVLGEEKSPSFKFVNADVSISGRMPDNIRQLFENIDALCMTNGTDYFAVSIDSKLIDNGVYNSAIAFVVTNTSLLEARQNGFHPILERLKCPPYDCNKNCDITNSIPLGANPSRWFSVDASCLPIK